MRYVLLGLVLLCLLGWDGSRATADDAPSEAPSEAPSDAPSDAKRLESLRRDLQSEKARTVAHAAFAAGEEKRAALVGDLIPALAAWSAPTKSYGGMVTRQLLDALIRLDARVPLKHLVPLEARAPSGVLILAVRGGPAAFPILRRALSGSIRRLSLGPATHPRRLSEFTAEGVAAGNTLVAARDEHVAALLLPTIGARIHVHVTDETSDTIGIGGGAGGAFG